MPTIVRRPSRPRLLILALVALTVTMFSPLAFTPAPAAAEGETIKINEVESNGGDPADWVELINTGGSPVDISGYVVKDNDNTHVVTVPASTTIAAGGFYVVVTDVAPFNVGLGGADSARLFLPDGTSLLDTYSWTAHATTTYGRCPDGTGAFITTTASTKGAANDCRPPVKINEIESNGDVNDWVELINTSASPVDIGGLIFKDNVDADIYTIPTGTTIAANGYYVLEGGAGGFSFGLGGADSARLFMADGTVLIDSYDWTAHAGVTYGRCPNGTGSFTNNTTSTKGLANDCSSPLPPVKINEIESNGDVTDWVELINTSASPANIGGLIFKDNVDADIYTIPSGTTIAANGFYVLEGVTPGFTFGLGSADSARLFASDGVIVIDAYDWTAHAAVTYGRCPDGTGAFVNTVASTKGTANSCPVVSAPVKINEVESSGGTPGDWVELINTTSSPIDLAGWSIKDGDDAHTAVPFAVGVNMPSTVIPANGFFVVEEAFLGFGLGTPDSVRLYNPSSVLVETYSWTPHAATTYGRCPDATGEFITTTSSTKGATNDCSVPLKINEVESNGDTTDWIELINNGSATLDISGYVLKDNTENDPFTVPALTTLAPGAYYVVEPVFGLGGADSARLFAPGGTTLLDSYTWTAHASTTYGRCPNGSGAFTTTTASTKGALNACPGDIAADPWPGSPNVTIVDATGAFPSNLSGLAYEASGNAQPGVMWAVRNGIGALFRLVWNGSIWTPDTTNGWTNGKLLHYATGTDDVDAEGVGFAASPAGGIYVASERNNSNNGVSRNAILRYDPTVSGGDLNALNEWNITADIPATTPNTGLEAVTWIPDSFLVANGFVDESTGALYNPANYAAHAGGVFFVGVEQTGSVYGYVLNHATGNTFTKVATISSGFVGVMELNFDRDQGTFWVVCDDGCLGRSTVFEIGANGKFAPAHYYERPANAANLNNEGFAVAADAECTPAGEKPVYWSDDTGTGGHAIRAGTLPCTFVDLDADDDGFTDEAEIASAGMPAGNLLGSDPHNTASTPEVCDGIDNDLNEGVDEGFADTDNDGIKDCVDPQNDTDTDNDGVRDEIDNCDRSFNPNQADSDNDGKGNTCDADGLVPAACAAMTIDNVIKGTTGNDTISGTAFNDLILAQSGNDTVNGLGGNDCIDSGNGNDTVTTLDGNDVIIDSAGNDNIDAGNGSNVIRSGNGNDNVRTGSGADDIEVTGGNNVIQSGGGGDRVVTGSGSDTICTGSYASFGNIGTCTGGAEADNVDAGGGNNKINAGEGDNKVFAASGNDEIVTGTGDDTIDAGGGNNKINAGDGENTIGAGSGNDEIVTGSGTDLIDAGGGSNKVNAGDGDNTISAGSGNDEIVTGSGTDLIDAGGGNNKINAGDGDNTIGAGSGNDEIVTGLGADLIDAGGGNNKVNAGDGANTVTTGSGNDTVVTGSGNDLITTNGGNDSIDCGAGTDVANSGSGNDTNVANRCETFS